MILNKVFLHQKGYIEIRVVGDQTAKSIQAMGDKIVILIEAQRTHDAPVLILDDLRQMGQVSAEGRKLVVELAKKLTYEKLVMVGKGTALRLGANLMLRATGKSATIKYMENYNTAVKWLIS